MARPKKKASGSSTAEAYLGLLHGAQQQFGESSVYSGEVLSERHIGLPLQSLALEYLFGSDKLILGKSYGIAGPPGSFKSSLQLDFMRHICSFTGSGYLVESEGEKISAPLAKSMCGQMSQRITIHPVDSVDEAQRALTFAIEYGKKNFPDRNFLIAIGLDSLSGSSTEERGDKIRKEGAAQRDYSSEALLWTQWLKTYASKIAGWPITLMYVNHEKPKIDGQTSHEKTKSGGLAQDFHATVYLSIRRIKESRGATCTLTWLRLRSEKNSFGEHRRAIDTLFVYDHSGPTAKMYFDWDHATAELLVQHKNAVKDIIEVTASTENMAALTRSFSCRQLGLTAVPGVELGTAVHSNEELLSDLRRRLGINSYGMWTGAMPIPTVNAVPNDSVDSEGGENEPLEM